MEHFSSINKLLFAVFVALMFSSLATAETQIDPLAPINCYKKAKEIRGLKDTDAAFLCNHAKSNAPVECYNLAVDIRGFSRLNATDLCRKAESKAPITCYNAAIELPGFSINKASDLCCPHCTR